MGRSIRLFAAVLAFGAFGLFAASAQADVVWLCKPGLADNPCEIPQDTTFRYDGEPDEVVTPPDGPRQIDCFYVYPTVSNQTTANADKSRDPELESIAQYQAARFSQQCRVFAPIYRQGTLYGIAGGVAGGESNFDRELAYGDVREAWREYLREENDGRGVVLIGHSQGTFMLRELIAREIEEKPAQRRRVVSSLLLGGNVTVPEGEVVGGDFRRTPLCETRFQLGCVVAYSSFAQDPPEDARFGTPEEVGQQIACTDPRKLVGSKQALSLIVPTEPFATGPIAIGIVITSNGTPPTADTTWVSPPDRYGAACREINGADVLRLTPKPGAQTPTFFPEPGWGTHLIDVNIALDPLVSLVERQAQRWTDPELKLKRRCGKAGGMRLRIKGSEAELAERVAFKLGRRTIAKDREAPFRAHMRVRDLRGSRATTVGANLTLALGEERRVKLARPVCR